MDVVVVGAGEYTTGYVHGAASKSDKKIGVVGLVLFDLRRRGLVNKISICDRTGLRFAAIRDHFQEKISKVYNNLDVSFVSYPEDDVVDDCEAYIKALKEQKKGSCVIIFTPDPTHYPIAQQALHHGMHVLVAKPAVQELRHHLDLMDQAAKKNLCIAVEFHKRWDPLYADAKQRSAAMGAFSFFQSYMSQPKTQLDTFRSWAGSCSDISYYLNSHHIDFHVWSVKDSQVPMLPLRVMGMASRGTASRVLDRESCEDTITLSVDWGVPEGDKEKYGEHEYKGHAVYTASWISPKSDVHSQQRFFYQCADGEISIDQAHRGYTMAHERDGFLSINPLYMKYTPDGQGNFAGQQGYGYQSIEAFITALTSYEEKIEGKDSDFTPEQRKQLLDTHTAHLASLECTTLVTAILHAGRLSIDNKCEIRIEYDTQRRPTALRCGN